MTSKHITKANAKKFVKLVKAYMSKFTPENNDDGEIYTQWILQTECGRLSVTLYDDQAYCYTVFTRFMDDLTEAKRRIGPSNMNRFSGKWNIHVSGPDLVAMQEALKILDEQLAVAGVKGESK